MVYLCPIGMLYTGMCGIVIIYTRRETFDHTILYTRVTKANATKRFQYFMSFLFLYMVPTHYIICYMLLLYLL